MKFSWVIHPPLHLPASRVTSCSFPGFQVWSFTGHRINDPTGLVNSGSVAVLRADLDQQRRADAALAVAAARRGLRPPRGQDTRQNLLRRNFCIARDSDIMLAVGRWDQSRRLPAPHICVAGGTGWACQMFADLQARKIGPMGTPMVLPLFLFSLEAGTYSGIFFRIYGQFTAYR